MIVRIGERTQVLDGVPGQGEEGSNARVGRQGSREGASHRHAQEGHVASHQGDQDIVVGSQERATGHDNSIDRTAESSTHDRVGVPIQVDREVALQELQAARASDESQA